MLSRMSIVTLMQVRLNPLVELSDLSLHSPVLYAHVVSLHYYFCLHLGRGTMLVEMLSRRTHRPWRQVCAQAHKSGGCSVFCDFMTSRMVPPEYTTCRGFGVRQFSYVCRCNGTKDATKNPGCDPSCDQSGYQVDQTRRREITNE